MEGFVDKLLDVLIAVVLFFALIGVIISSTNSTDFTWSAVNVGGTVKDLSFVPYLIVLIILVGAIVLVYRYLMKHRHR